MIGGTALQVAAASDRPVVVVPVADLVSPGPLVRSVLVGIDGLPESADAAAWAVRAWPDARFTAIHALELAPAFVELPHERETDEAYRRIRARANRVMRDRWCRPFGADGVTFECVVEDGNAVEILLAAVARAAADVVVVSRRDHHLRRGTLGGVSQRLLAHAACAVMMVPSHS
jgi:nucleotide-binding universal stress UspA family protein